MENSTRTSVRLILIQTKKRNHYNVKLLRGYGVSITLKNSKIILKNGTHDVTGESEKEEWFVNRMPYEKIVISFTYTELFVIFCYK